MALLRAQLLGRIHRRYQTYIETITLADREFQFTRIADPNVVLDEVCIEEDRLEKISGKRNADPQHLPYWAQLWDSALAVASAALREDLSSASRVLDLGCGMGLAGAVAATTGAHVLLADLESPALLFAKLNAVTFLGKNSRKIQTRQLNWQRDRLHRKFDLILGADIFYERGQWEFLDLFWREHLAPAGKILLGEPGRQSGIHFIPWIQQRGWTLRERPEPVPTRPTPIKIFRLTRASESASPRL